MPHAESLGAEAVPSSLQEASDRGHNRLKRLAFAAGIAAVVGLEAVGVIADSKALIIGGIGLAEVEAGVAIGVATLSSE